MNITRRDCLSQLTRTSSGLLGLAMLSGNGAGAESAAAAKLEGAASDRSGCTLGFSTYGMKSLSTEKCVQVVADTGYDTIEIAARPDWDAAPQRMTPARRRAVRQLLNDRGLGLSALMEHLQPTRTVQTQRQNLDRIQRVADLGQELVPDSTGMIQTTLGGRDWEQSKSLYRDRLGRWIEVGQKMRTVIAIKPHRGGGMSRPTEAVWLIEQLGKSPWLRIVYDYSHYAFRDMAVDQTVKQAAPYLGHVAIKDAVREGKRVVFKLPGASGMFDYAQLFRLLYQQGYRADICCEVSGMVWGQKGYDPVEAAAACYRAIAPLFKTAEVPRR